MSDHALHSFIFVTVDHLYIQSILCTKIHSTLFNTITSLELWLCVCVTVSSS